MRKKSIAHTLVFGLLLTVLGMPKSSCAFEAEDPVASWSFLVGYAVSHTNWGDSHVHVESVDLVARYAYPITRRIGRGWYEGYHSLQIEIPFHLVVDPDFAPMYGVSFQGCWTFTGWPQGRPYVFAGGGPLYSEADIDGMGGELNGNYQFGFGYLITWKKGRKIHLEYRWHHISNGGSEEPNDPVNSSRVLVGIRF